MKPLGCLVLGCDWGKAWMSSDGWTRRICRRCGDWRGLDLEDPPRDGETINAGRPDNKPWWWSPDGDRCNQARNYHTTPHRGCFLR